MKKLLILLAILFTLVGCDEVMDSPEVKKCKLSCESSKMLQGLQKKVVYKPISLCQKRCSETAGNCISKTAKQGHPMACIYYGMNAGSMSPRLPGSMLKNIHGK